MRSWSLSLRTVVVVCGTLALSGTASAAPPKPTTWLGEQIAGIRALVSPPVAGAVAAATADADAKLKAIIDERIETAKQEQERSPFTVAHRTIQIFINRWKLV